MKRYLVREDSHVNNHPTVRPIAWGIESQEEADRIAQKCADANRNDGFTTPSTYSVQELKR